MNFLFCQGKEYFEDAATVRTAVFVNEQGFHDEFDEIDKVCTHCVLYDQGEVVACGRFYDDQGKAMIGRIAVLAHYRDQHLGLKMMQEIELCLQKQGYNEVYLSAQCQASGFYEKQGYQTYGEIFLDEDCPHIKMVKKMGGD